MLFVCVRVSVFVHVRVPLCVRACECVCTFVYVCEHVFVHDKFCSVLFLDKPLSSSEAGALYTPAATKLVEGEKQVVNSPKQLTTIEKLSVSIMQHHFVGSCVLPYSIDPHFWFDIIKPSAALKFLCLCIYVSY